MQNISRYADEAIQSYGLERKICFTVQRIFFSMDKKSLDHQH